MKSKIIALLFFPIWGTAQDIQDAVASLKETANTMSRVAIHLKAWNAAMTLPDGEDKDAILKALDLLAEINNKKADFPDASTTFAKWERGSVAKPEIRATELKALIGGAEEITTNTGTTIKLSDVTMLTPQGLKYISSSGISIAPSAELPEELLLRAGWTKERQQKYTEQLAQENAIASRQAAEARMAANKPPTRGSTESPRLTPIEIPGDIEAIIDAQAKKEYPSDFSMQEYVRKKQRTAYDQLVNYQKNGAAGVPGQEMDGIIARAIAQWKNQFDMVVYEIGEEVAAYRKLEK